MPTQTRSLPPEMWPETLAAVHTALETGDAADVHKARNLLLAAQHAEQHAATDPEVVTAPNTLRTIRDILRMGIDNTDARLRVGEVVNDFFRCYPAEDRPR